MSKETGGINEQRPEEPFSCCDCSGPGRGTAGDEIQAVLRRGTDARSHQRWPWSCCLCRALAQTLGYRLLVSPRAKAASAWRSEAQPSRKKGQLLPPLLPSRLEAGRSLRGTAQHLRSSLGSSCPLIIIPPGWMRTQSQRPLWASM